MKTILFILLNSFSLGLFSQQWQWAFPIDGNAGSWVFNVQTDSTGSPYFMGTCSAQTNFNGKNGSYPTSGYKSFITSFTKQGAINWISGGSGLARSATIDENGNSYFTGGFNGTAFFGKQTYTLQNTSFNNTQDDFLVKLDSTGKAVFFNSQGSSCSDEGTSINCFGKEDIVVSGYDQTYCNMAGSWTTYFKKINSSGSEAWSLNPPISYFSEDPISRTKDNGFLLSSTYSPQMTEFAGLTDTISLQPAIDATDAFIAKYTLSGNIKWVRAISGKNYQFPRNISVDNSNNIIMAIESLDTCYYDNIVLLPKGERTLNLIKTDSLGNYIRHISFESSLYPPHFWMMDIKSDALDNIYLATQTDTSLNFGSSILNFNLQSNEKAISIIKLDESFNFLWSQWLTISKWSNPAATMAVTDSAIYIGLSHDSPVQLNGSNFQFPASNGVSHTSFVGAIYNGSIPLSVKEDQHVQLNIFPNPASGIFTISGKNISNSSICIYDIIGNCVLDKTTIKNTTHNLDLSDQAKGIYFVEIVSDNQRTVKKISLQ